MRIPHEAAAAAMKIPFTHADWMAVLPVGVVAVAALVVLVADLFTRRRDQRYLSVGIGLAGTIVAAILAARQFGHNHDAFFGGFMTGGFATVFEEIILIALAGSLVLYGAIGPTQRVAGTTAIMLWSACGAMLMAGAANLLMIFLGLELLSLGLYALCGAVDRKAAARVGTQVSDSQLDRNCIFALRHARCSSVRREACCWPIWFIRGSRSIRSSGWAPECFSSGSSLS